MTWSTTSSVPLSIVACSDEERVVSKYKVADHLEWIRNNPGLTAQVAAVTPAGNCIVSFMGIETLYTEKEVDATFKKVEPFFQMGKTYRFKTQTSGTYRIEELYRNENPKTGHELQAQAIVTERSGTRRTFLSDSHFQAMEEVEEWSSGW